MAIATALTKETGSIVSGANAYINTSDFENYFDLRGNTDAVALVGSNEEAVIGGILYATRWIDANYSFVGSVQDAGQPLKWPRWLATDDDQRTLGAPIGGGTVDETAMPDELLEACAEVAFDHVNANPINKVVSMGDGLDALKVGPIALDFRKNAVGKVTRDYVDELLSRWTTVGGRAAIRMSRF